MANAPRPGIHLLCFLAALLIRLPLQAQPPLNLDLERTSPTDSTRPWGWTFGYSAFARPANGFGLDSTVSHGGRRSLRIAVPDSMPSMQARSFTDHRLIATEGFPGPRGSLEGILHGLPRPAGTVGWIVDLRAAHADNEGRWLWMPRPIRHIGYAAFDYGFEMLAAHALEFDGVVFINHTSASRLLR